MKRSRTCCKFYNYLGLMGSNNCEEEYSESSRKARMCAKVRKQVRRMNKKLEVATQVSKEKQVVVKGIEGDTVDEKEEALKVYEVQKRINIKENLGNVVSASDADGDDDKIMFISKVKKKEKGIEGEVDTGGDGGDKTTVVTEVKEYKNGMFIANVDALYGPSLIHDFNQFEDKGVEYLGDWNVEQEKIWRKWVCPAYMDIIDGISWANSLFDDVMNYVDIANQIFLKEEWSEWVVSPVVISPPSEDKPQS